MAASLAWRNAVALTNASLWYEENLYSCGFDKRLPIDIVVRFQIDYRGSGDPTLGCLLSAFADHVEDACKSGVLKYEESPRGGISPSYWLIAAADFAAWLATNGMQPSVHIQAWFDETGVTFGNAIPVEEKPLSTRERNTLLAIIAALCKEAKIDYTKPAKAAGQILHTIDSMGLQIGETTIESHLKKIPGALETRMK